MQYALILALLALVIYFRFGKKALAGLFTCLAFVFLLRGLWPVSALLFGLAYYLVRRENWSGTILQDLFKNRAASPRGTQPGPPGKPRLPRLQSRYLTLYLNPQDGRISAEVRNGPERGNWLDDLKEAQLRELKKHYDAADHESAAFLYAYLDQAFPSWRQQGNEEKDKSSDNINFAARPLSRNEALAVLGLDQKATEAEIKKAHRKLMMKFHPDQGGAPILAAKLNMAKDTLT